MRAETKQEDMLGQPSCSRDDEPLPARNFLLGESRGGNTNNNLRSRLWVGGIEFIRILPGLTSLIQPLDVEFFRQYELIVKRLTESLAIKGQGGPVAARGGAINMHSVVWNQVSVAAYHDLIVHGWRNIDTLHRRDELHTMSTQERANQLQFSFQLGPRCKRENCSAPASIWYAHRGTLLCEKHGG